MIPQFENLSAEEKASMLNAIPLITVLIAGADGEIDDEEKAWGSKLTKIRTYAHPDNLQPFYEEVGSNYEKQVDDLIKNLPKDTAQRNEAISGGLAKLNDIFPKLDINFAKRLYDSFTSFAEHVAKASGGFLRIGSISAAEKQWIELPMITPIEIEQS